MDHIQYRHGSPVPSSDDDMPELEPCRSDDDMPELESDDDIPELKPTIMNKSKYTSEELRQKLDLWNNEFPKPYIPKPYTPLSYNGLYPDMVINPAYITRGRARGRARFAFVRSRSGSRSRSPVSLITKTLPKEKKQEPTPDEIFNNFLNSLDTTNSKQINFKNLCDSLNLANEVHVKVKEIIMSYIGIGDLEIDEIFTMILSDIYNNNLTDFTIKFPDKSLKCFKAILKTIPYFEMIFQDLEIDDSIDFTTDYELISILVKLLHIPETDDLTIFNFIDLFVMMDKYLMKDHIHIMLQFAKKNIIDIIEYSLANKQFENILILYDLLNNIKSNLSNGDTKNTKDTKEINYDITKIIDKIFTIDFGPNMFMFANWVKLFTDDKKMEAIQITGNYNLLNISKINPKKVLVLLANIDFSSKIYSELYNRIEYDNMDVHHNKDLIILQTGVPSLIIINYYPIFECKCLEYVPAEIPEKLGDLIMIRFTKYSQISLSVNSILVFTNKQYYENITNTYTIQKIVKYSNEKQTEVSHAEYVSPKVLDYVLYGIYLDKPLEEDRTSMISVYKHIVHEIPKF